MNQPGWVRIQPARGWVDFRPTLTLLGDLWSPQQISQHLQRAYAEDATMRVSHETIYQALFVQGRGSLRKELTACLRWGRTSRRAHGRSNAGNSITAMVMISDRPAEVEDRAVPGHWEGDLMIGGDLKSAMGTLVERKTRFVLLLHLPDGECPLVDSSDHCNTVSPTP